MEKRAAWISCVAMLIVMIFSAAVSMDYESAGSNGYYIGTNEWMWPVPDCRTITSGFGHRISPAAGASSDHKGIDIGCAEGTNIVAAKDGEVIIAQTSSSEGNWIAIKHNKHWTSYYMHCSTLLVDVGDQVTKGQVIALSGNTGISTGPHCHFAVLKDGTYMNPLKYVDADEKIVYASGGASGVRKEMVDYALQFVGNPYVYGGTSLTNGTDCSGFTMRIYEHFQIAIPRTAAAQYAASEQITRDKLLPGDLLFYQDSSGGIGHVTMYIGNDQVVHASNRREGIKISSISYRQPCGYGRFIQASYTDEDLKYMSAVIAAEALSNSKQGQAGVGYVVMNRVAAGGGSVKKVVTAPNQFNSPWPQYVKKGAPGWAVETAVEVLEGTAENPIGTKKYFCSKSYAREKKIEEKGIEVGDNVFFDECEW